MPRSPRKGVEGSTDLPQSEGTLLRKVKPLFPSLARRRGRFQEAPPLLTKIPREGELPTGWSRRSFTNMMLDSIEPEQQQFRDANGQTQACVRDRLEFVAPSGLRCHWVASRDLVVEGPDSELYAMEVGLRWDFVASVKAPALEDGEIPILRVRYVWTHGSGRRTVLLTHQPSETRRAYSLKHGIPPNELGLDT